MRLGARQPILIGGVVLLARLATLPRTPWDPAELRFPFFAMVALSLAASVTTAIVIAVRDPLASLLFSFSAAVLVHGPAARVDAFGWLFVALAFLSLRKPVLLGAFAAAATACGIVSALAMFFAALILIVTERRDRFLATVAFLIVLLPFVTIPETLTPPPGFSVTRFTLHPWGSKFVALPLLVAVAAGIRPLVRKWSAELEVLMWFAVVHVAIGIALVDPADGVRYAVPSLLFTAFVASEGLRALRVGWVGAAVLAALSVWYAWPILRDRVTRPSPPVEAAREIPAGTVVLADQETAPFAKGLPLDDGLRRHVDDTVPLLHFAYGNSNAPGARVFSRDDGDAYGKLTRNAYRHVSLVPVIDRFAPVRGMFGLERNEAGETWRWLEREAVVRVPRGRAMARVTLRLPSDATLESNDIQINATRVTVRRGETIETLVPLEQPLLLFRAASSYDLAPPDTRRVAVQVVTIR